MENLVGHGDSYSGSINNYFLYRGPTSGRFDFIPWGADLVLHPSTKRLELQATGKLAWRLFNLPETRARFVATFRKLLATIWKEQELLAEIDRMQKLIVPVAAEDPLLTAGKSPDLAANIEEVRAFIRGRRAQLEPLLHALRSGRPQRGCTTATKGSGWDPRAGEGPADRPARPAGQPVSRSVPLPAPAWA